MFVIRYLNNGVAAFNMITKKRESDKGFTVDSPGTYNTGFWFAGGTKIWGSTLIDGGGSITGSIIYAVDSSTEIVEIIIDKDDASPARYIRGLCRMAPPCG